MNRVGDQIQPAYINLNKVLNVKQIKYSVSTMNATGEGNNQ